MFLKQSTASQTRLTPRFVDSTDFFTPETGLTIANTDVKLSKNGAASANKNSGGGTHIEAGRYALTFDATDTSVVGELAVGIIISGALPVEFKYFVLEEAVYDALFAASALGPMLLYTQPTGFLAATFPTGTVANTTNITAGTITTVTTTTTATNLTNAPTAGDFTATMKTSIGTAVAASAVASVTGAVGSVASGGITAASFAADAITAAKIAADVTTELQAGLATAANLATVAGFIDTEVASILAAVDTEVAAIKAKTDQLVFTVANQVDANLQSVNDTALIGNGGSTPWGP
jgi:hypothetical protein